MDRLRPHNYRHFWAIHAAAIANERIRWWSQAADIQLPLAHPTYPAIITTYLKHTRRTV